LQRRGFDTLTIARVVDDAWRSDCGECSPPPSAVRGCWMAVGWCACTPPLACRGRLGGGERCRVLSIGQKLSHAFGVRVTFQGCGANNQKRRAGHVPVRLLPHRRHRYAFCSTMPAHGARPWAPAQRGEAMPRLFRFAPVLLGSRRPAPTRTSMCSVASRPRSLCSLRLRYAAARLARSNMGAFPLRLPAMLGALYGALLLPTAHPATAPALLSAAVPDAALPPPSMESYLRHPCRRHALRRSFTVSFRSRNAIALPRA